MVRHPGKNTRFEREKIRGRGKFNYKTKTKQNLKNTKTENNKRNIQNYG